MQVPDELLEKEFLALAETEGIAELSPIFGDGLMGQAAANLA